MKIMLMSRFAIEFGNKTVNAEGFKRRHAALLVKLLALSTDRRMHREQVIDALWPDSTVNEAAPRLHKAASYARSAVGDKQLIVIRDEVVMLWPDADPHIDVREFEKAADRAVSVEAARAALDLYGGVLLPSDPYEDWIVEARERVQVRYLDLLRAAHMWEAVLNLEPADEEAHLVLMRQFRAEGQRLSTLRQFERLEKALKEELGVSPSAEATAIRSEVIHERNDRLMLVNRTGEREIMQRALDDAHVGSGSFVLLSGAAGIGKTALADWFLDRAENLGWISGRSIAASVDGPWPYAPVLEAIEKVLQEAPELLDDLPETHRVELMRVREAPGSTHDGSGDEDGHQRLFIAVDELVRLASVSRGLILFIDDLHVADDASLALLHYIARQASRSRLLIVATARSGVEGQAFETLRGLVGRHGAREIRVGPLNLDHSTELINSMAGETLPDSTVEQILELAGGSPFYVEELTRSISSGSVDGLPARLPGIVTASFVDLDERLRDALARVAVAGLRFDTDQFIALSGLDEEEAFDLLDQAMASEIVEHAAGGYQWRHGLVRESLLADLAPHRRRIINRDAALKFESMGAPPSRIAHHLIAADSFAEAAPWVLLAARAAQSVGALSDARGLIDSVLEQSTGEERLGLLALRADVLAGMADPGAVAAYQSALAETDGAMRRLLYAKMARAALMGGDIATAESALTDLRPDGGPFDGPVLHAQGMLAYMTGDLETAEEAAGQARKFALGEGAPTALLDVLTLQGMIAHNKGEWFDRMRLELKATADSAELASTVFDCHL